MWESDKERHDPAKGDVYQMNVLDGKKIIGKIEKYHADESLIVTKLDITYKDLRFISSHFVAIICCINLIGCKFNYISHQNLYKDKIIFS